MLSRDLTEPAGATTKRTWFDNDLLEFLSALRLASPQLSDEALAQTIFSLYSRSFTDPYVPAEDCPLRQDTVRKTLGRTLDEFDNVQFMISRELESLIEDNSLLGCCMACSQGMFSCSPEFFGGMQFLHKTVATPATARVAGEKCHILAGGEDSSERKCHLYADGNFRLAHLSDAGLATTHDVTIAHRFADSDEVQSFCDLRANIVPPSESEPCNDFNADQALGRVRSKFDVTGEFPRLRNSTDMILRAMVLSMSVCAGVFGVFCRH